MDHQLVSEYYQKFQVKAKLQAMAESDWIYYPKFKWDNLMYVNIKRLYAKLCKVVPNKV